MKEIGGDNREEKGIGNIDLSYQSSRRYLNFNDLRIDPAAPQMIIFKKLYSDTVLENDDLLGKYLELDDEG